MGQRLDVSDSTARRQRRRLDKAGLIEVLGYGRDGNSCLVRPILRDGTPVFPDPEMPSRPVTSDHPPRSELTADLSTKTPKTEKPPLPPASPNATGEGGEAFDRFQEEPTEEQPTKPKSAESGIETAGVADQVPAPTQPQSPETAPAGSTAAPPAARPGPDAIDPAVPAMSFLQFWVAMGQTGREGYARAQWGRLSATDKAAIRDRLGRPRSWAADLWAGTWLRGRCWEEAVPATARPEQVFIRENTPEWRCWQRHLVATKGKGTPVDNRGGWWFPSRLPPLTDAEVPPKETGDPDPDEYQEASMTKEVPAHIQRHRVGRASAALPEWAAVKFTDAQAAAMRPVGIEMLNKRGVCALHLKIIADAAGVGIGAAREAINIADTIGLITIERHLRGLYNMRSRSPEWLAGLRE
jgi:hypothetical protein